MTFKDGETILGSSTLTNGRATYSTSTLSVGSHSITAVYDGDTAFAGSTSSAVDLTVKAAAGLSWALIGGILVGAAVVGLFFLLVIFRRRRRHPSGANVVSRDIEGDNVASIAQELEGISVPLDGAEVSMARLFLALREAFARGLGQTVIWQFIPSVFQEKAPGVWAAAQSELITKLSVNKLIRNEQRQTSRDGTETYFLLTELGSKVLDRLSDNLVTLKVEVAETEIEPSGIVVIDTTLRPSTRMQLSKVSLECGNRIVDGSIRRMQIPHFIDNTVAYKIEFRFFEDANSAVAWEIGEMMRTRTGQQRRECKLKIEANGELWISPPVFIPTKIDEAKLIDEAQIRPSTSHKEDCQI